MRLTYELPEVFTCTVLRVDVVIVGNVVAVILSGRGIEGEYPDRVDAECMDVFESSGQAGEVPDAVVVGILERANVHFVDDRILVPKRVAHGGVGPCVHSNPAPGRVLHEIVEVPLRAHPAPDAEDVCG